MTGELFSGSAKRCAFVTGATGFVGSNLVRRLVADGWDTHIVVRSDSKLELLDDVTNRIIIHRHDGTTEDMLDIIGASKPEMVFHLASLFLAQHTFSDIERLVSSNLLFATQLIEAMTANGVHLLVNTGTSWQHFENQPYSPVNLYAAMKQAFEAILQYYVEACSLRVITLKLFDTYGPNDPRPKLLHLLKKIADEGTVLAMSPGEQLIDLVYIDDVIEAFLLAARRLQTKEVQLHESYAVNSGKPLKLRELVKVYSHVTGKDLPIEWGYRPYRQREVMVPWNRDEALLGWSPKIGLEEGIKKMEHKSGERSK